MQQSPLTREDVVIAIAVEPDTFDAIELARYARDTGAREIGIADRSASPLADCADDVLLFPVRSPSVYPLVGATALVEVLVGMVAARSGSRTPNPAMGSR